MVKAGNTKQITKQMYVEFYVLYDFGLF